LAGNTSSNDIRTSDSALYKSSLGGGDIFVTKFNPTLTKLIYSTYIGGAKYDNVECMDIDAEGCVYITGHTLSNNFPIHKFIGQSLKPDTSNIFVSKLNQNGSGLIYSTSISSNRNNRATGIVVDGSKYAHISGYTTSTDYPVT
jgi:hypothetical protein